MDTMTMAMIESLNNKLDEIIRMLQKITETQVINGEMLEEIQDSLRELDSRLK